MNKFVHLCLFLILILTLPVSTPPATATAITSCQTLATEGATYTLQNDVRAPGTCFTVSADNITLNLNGHTVTYNSAHQTVATNAILVTENNKNFTVYNGSLTEGSGISVAGSSVIK